eukprot:gnl/MRDRNA2_/MRDRNA2_125203_c0_seq1.p1 gnl/MRDRNA2_/MRDRNA2_125203_c0~~gnl/MRDRNA2_/MRDRNA2_125203_c0_seq1.p1  ORF type:complete len:252 (-),score=51.35 gnl/MRDRNA2_/MRDRNA2_125203_c0_seq1:37-792(-)
MAAPARHQSRERWAEYLQYAQKAPKTPSYMLNPEIQYYPSGTRPRFSRTRQWWEERSKTQRTQALVAAAVVVAVVFRMPFTLLVVVLLGKHLAAKLPTVESFDQFFCTWFKDNFIPLASGKVQREIEAKARINGYTGELAGNFGKWLLGQAIALKGTVWWQLWGQYCLPPQILDFVVLYIADINLGTPDKPRRVTFVGFNGAWFSAPWSMPDIESGSLLELAELHKMWDVLPKGGNFDKKVREQFLGATDV